MGNRDEALANLAAIDADEIDGDFYTFAARRAEILHASAAWGFCGDAAIMQRLLQERDLLIAERDSLRNYITDTTAPPDAQTGQGGE